MNNIILNPLIERFLKENNETIESIQEDVKKGYREEIFADINIYAENNEPFTNLTEIEVGFIACEFLDMMEGK